MSTNDVKIFLSHYASHRPREESDRTEGQHLTLLMSGRDSVFLGIEIFNILAAAACSGLKTELKVNFAK